jgi:hypothetical protein
MEPTGYLETSVQNYHSMLRNIPEERGTCLKLIPWMNQIPFTLFINTEQDSPFQHGGNWTSAFKCQVSYIIV